MKVYWISLYRWRFKLLHIHTGFNDYHLLWLVNGKVMDVLFIRVKI